jgi:hypothetical protein
MDGFEILIPLLAILIGGTAVIVPVIGLTARFALKPMVETWARVRESPADAGRVREMERRIGILEEQVNSLERSNSRLLEEADFRLQLEGKR